MLVVADKETRCRDGDCERDTMGTGEWWTGGEGARSPYIKSTPGHATRGRTRTELSSRDQHLASICNLTGRARALGAHHLDVVDNANTANTTIMQEFVEMSKRRASRDYCELCTESRPVSATSQ